MCVFFFSSVRLPLSRFPSSAITFTTTKPQIDGIPLQVDEIFTILRARANIRFIYLRIAHASPPFQKISRRIVDSTLQMSRKECRKRIRKGKDKSAKPVMKKVTWKSFSRRLCLCMSRSPLNDSVSTGRLFYQQNGE